MEGSRSRVTTTNSELWFEVSLVWDEVQPLRTAAAAVAAAHGCVFGDPGREEGRPIVEPLFDFHPLHSLDRRKVLLTSARGRR